VSATARLTILDLSQLAPGARRFEVACEHGTTGLTHIPSPSLDLSDGTLVLVAAWEHESRCGACDLEGVLDRGDQEVRELVEAAWARVQAAAMRERAN
jgi:hypothetical protein